MIAGLYFDIPPTSINERGHISRTSKINLDFTRFANKNAPKKPTREGEEYIITVGFKFVFVRMKKILRAKISQLRILYRPRDLAFLKSLNLIMLKRLLVSSSFVRLSSPRKLRW